eukprot:TRINITY_DN2496_c0_g1_i1.p1 TRINITY_DN2496_c0_g1~~TRINITY_DN2496_c0_g1_i1.p1  ORF type:complete len:498 (-),score=48.77 TRINITY_DN2496_c0_g1_i1:174-1667(-)
MSDHAPCHRDADLVTVDQFTEAIRRDPRNAALYAGRSKAHALTCAHQEAESDAVKSIFFAPQAALGFIRLAEALVAQNRPQDALTAVREGLQVDPQNATLLGMASDAERPAAAAADVTSSRVSADPETAAPPAHAENHPSYERGAEVPSMTWSAEGELLPAVVAVVWDALADALHALPEIVRFLDPTLEEAVKGIAHTLTGTPLPDAENEVVVDDPPAWTPTGRYYRALEDVPLDWVVALLRHAVLCLERSKGWTAFEPPAACDPDPSMEVSADERAWAAETVRRVLARDPPRMLDAGLNRGHGHSQGSQRPTPRCQTNWYPVGGNVHHIAAWSLVQPPPSASSAEPPVVGAALALPPSTHGALVKESWMALVAASPALLCDTPAARQTRAHLAPPPLPSHLMHHSIHLFAEVVKFAKDWLWWRSAVRNPVYHASLHFGSVFLMPEKDGRKYEHHPAECTVVTVTTFPTCLWRRPLHIHGDEIVFPGVHLRLARHSI